MGAPITLVQLQNAGRDADDLGAILTGPATGGGSVVATRLGGSVPTVAKALTTLTGLTPRGVYDGAATYAQGEVVSEDGTSYVSRINANTGHDPATSPTQWAVLAHKGDAGTSGSASSIKLSHSSAHIPLVNVFDFTAVQANYVTNNDGTLGFHAPGTLGGGPPIATGLIYCPGAVGLICNSTIATGGFGPGAFIQLFDVDGNFIGNAADPGSYHFDPGNVLTLPGTQFYVRFTLAGGMSYSDANTMVCVGAAPTLPGSFQAFGLDSVASVNAKDAIVAANASAALVAALTAAPARFSDAVLSGSAPGTRNVFNYRNILSGHKTAADGSTPVASDHNVATMYCPFATQFISDLPFEANATYRVCTYDASGNFIADITDIITVGVGGFLANFQAPGTVQALPGNQTYVKVAYSNAYTTPNTYGFAFSAQGAVFFAGTVSSPVPVSLVAAAARVPFAGNGSVTQRTAAALGAFADGNDCTAVLQAFLNTASITNPIELVLDGMLLTTGLVVKSYTTIRGIGWGSGLRLFDGSNRNLITAGALGSAPFGAAAAGSFDASLPARNTSHITLRDFTIDPNAAAQTDGFGVLFVNCSNVAMEQVNFTQAFYFASVFSNCDHVWVRGCKFTSGGTIHDGVHMDGPVEKVWIDSCKFVTGDDAIAINCPEGFGGDISDVIVSNCIFDNSLTVCRIYTSLQPAAMPTNNIHKARRIVFSNCVGRTSVCAFSLGINGPDGNQSQNVVDQIQDLLIENCDIICDTSGSGLGWILISDAVGLLNIRGCVMRSPQIAEPFVKFNGTSQAGNIVLSDITILRNSDGSASAPLFDNTNAISVGTLTVRGCRVVDEAGSAYAAIANALVFGAALAELVLDSVEMKHFTALAASFANVTTVRGAGVIATAAAIADAKMDNNAMYLSSDAGNAPSIKVAGTAKRFTLT